MSRAGLTWVLVALMVKHLTFARIAEGLTMAWNTANHAVLADGQRVLVGPTPTRPGVRTSGDGRRHRRPAAGRPGRPG